MKASEGKTASQWIVMARTPAESGASDHGRPMVTALRLRRVHAALDRRLFEHPQRACASRPLTRRAVTPRSMPMTSGAPSRQSDGTRPRTFSTRLWSFGLIHQGAPFARSA